MGSHTVRVCDHLHCLVGQFVAVEACPDVSVGVHLTMQDMWRRSEVHDVLTVFHQQCCF